MEKFYITTPIYYPSANLHIGHTYTTVAADAVARYKRLRGYDVMFLTGTDEHGQKIQRAAEAKGKTPKEYVDEIVAGVRDLWKLMNISNDRFIRTTDEQHVQAVQKIFKTLYDKGDIYKDEYEGLYCTPCESFWTEHQLVDGKCPDCGRPVEKTREESYFFRLSKYQDKLIDLIENTEFLEPATRRNEMLNNFLRPGLSDLCVSRTSFTWGVPVEFDKGHIVYVWLDALSNYITAMGAFSDDDADFKKYWPADVHLMAKEIVRFHTIIWPAILMALDLPLPKKVVGHGWMLLDGGKISKSSGNVIDPVILSEKYGVDALRYFVLREMPYGADSEFSNEALISRINADLANDLGNLVSRTAAMLDKYFGGTLPEMREAGEPDDSLVATAKSAAEKAEAALEGYNFSTALSEIWTLVSRTNKYIDETMPWALAKDEEKRARLATVLYNLLESVRTIAVLLMPFMPETADKIFTQLGLVTKDVTWESSKTWGVLPLCAQMTKADVLFPRIDMEKELEALAALRPKTSEPKKETKPEKAEITIEDFAKCSFCVASVLAAEEVKGSDKLLKLTVSTGDGERTVVSGIRSTYSAEDMVGKKVVLLRNLKPAKLRGIMSEGMLLCAESDGKLSLLTVDDDMPAGAEIS